MTHHALDTTSTTNPSVGTAPDDRTVEQRLAGGCASSCENPERGEHNHLHVAQTVASSEGAHEERLHEPSNQGRPADESCA